MAPTIKERIYAAIWEDIANGKYEPDHVFNEKALVEKYNVSKSPVRDALIELCSDGILRSIPRYGYEIVHISGKELREIMQMRALIELDNMNKSLELITPQQVEILKCYNEEVNEKLRRKEQTVRGHWENNVAFHKLLYSFGNNNFGALLLERCMRAQTIAYSMSYMYNVAQNELLDSDRHKSIATYIENGDKQAALEALQNDLGVLKSAGPISPSLIV